MNIMGHTRQSWVASRPQYIHQLTDEYIESPVSHAPGALPHYVRQPLGTDE
jgi:hypothetical protein